MWLFSLLALHHWFICKHDLMGQYLAFLMRFWLVDGTSLCYICIVLDVFSINNSVGGISVWIERTLLGKKEKKLFSFNHSWTIPQ